MLLRQSEESALLLVGMPQVTFPSVTALLLVFSTFIDGINFAARRECQLNTTSLTLLGLAFQRLFAQLVDLDAVSRLQPLSGPVGPAPRRQHAVLVVLPPDLSSVRLCWTKKI